MIYLYPGGIRLKMVVHPPWHGQVQGFGKHKIADIVVENVDNGKEINLIFSFLIYFPNDKRLLYIMKRLKIITTDDNYSLTTLCFMFVLSKTSSINLPGGCVPPTYYTDVIQKRCSSQHGDSMETDSASHDLKRLGCSSRQSSLNNNGSTPASSSMLFT